MASGAAGRSGEGLPKLQMTSASGPQQQAPAQPVKSTQDYNMVHMCRIAQELVHELITKIFEIFNLLKQTQLPNGVQPASEVNLDKRAKLQEMLRALPAHLKNVRLCYDAVEEAALTYNLPDNVGRGPGQVEDTGEGGQEGDQDCAAAIEQARRDTPEYKELMQQLIHRQRQLKEILDIERQALWDINAMLTMKKS